MIQFLITLWHVFLSRLRPAAPPPEAPVVPVEPPSPVIDPVEAPEPEGTPPPQSTANATLLFDTPQNAKHSIRVIADEEGLPLTKNFIVDGRPYFLKDVLCACIEQESSFYNYLNGQPVKHVNYAKDGKTVSSTDWGICQINDYFHIGKGKDFASVAYVLANPEACVRWTARLFKAGQMSLWDSYKSGAYKKFLPQ